MRVTKNIKNFINTEVEKRLMPKYETEKNEADRRRDMYNNFIDNLRKVAQTAAEEYFMSHFSEIADFAKDERSKDYDMVNLNCYRAASVKNVNELNSVFGWRRRMEKEVDKISDEIIVELELGGTKAELMEMLDKIGKGE